MRTPVPTFLPVTAEALAAANSSAALIRPYALSGSALPSFADVRSLGLSSTDQFCGPGTASQGAAWAGAVPVQGLNHWVVSVESFRANHVGGSLVDLQASSAWQHPSSRMLIASPDYTGHQRSAGSPARSAMLREPSRNAAWYASRSRATARSISEFVEAHGYLARGDEGYQFVLVECILEFGGWSHLGSWLHDLAESGMVPTFYCLDAAHAGATSHRERMYILFTRADRPLPDPVLRVQATCRRHGLVQATQMWSGGRRYWIGSYGRDYVWACPTCEQPATPVGGRAADVVDLSRPAPTMAERASGAAPKITDETVARIQLGRTRHGDQPLSVVTTRTRRAAKPLSEPLPTLTTQQEIGLWQPSPDGVFAHSTFRYLQPDDGLSAAAGIPSGYRICGTRIRDRVRQIGQSSPAPLITEFVARAAATLL